ncbi:MAG TPA: two-component regulator propeller domain-containing protein [Chitinophagales bacterium]|nr:two-component regulator propeller domain-containing protein [Chitinophagales bacterium]
MKRIIKYLAVAAAMLVGSISAGHAQEITSKYLQFELLTISDGLSQGMITCMLQDRFGFMWFGTKAGLNRYDGYNFVIYRHDPEDSTSLADNFIQSIFEDSKGRLWIGTANYGLDMFDRETETFYHFEHDENNANSLSDNRIVRVTEDLHHNLWVSTYSGLNKIAFQNFHDQQVPAASFAAAATFTRYFTGECRFTRVSDGTIWGSVLHEGSYHIYPGENNAVRIDTLDMTKYCWYPEKDNGLETYLFTVFDDTSKHQLFLFTEFSVTRINTSDNSVEIISKQRTHWGKFGIQECLDDNGMLWLSESDWLEQFDLQTAKWYHILAEDPITNSALHNSSLAYRDRSGIIWIGTKGFGILKYNPRSEKFHKTHSGSVQWMQATNNDSVVIVLNNPFFLSTYNFLTGKRTDLRDSSFIGQIKSYPDFGLTTAAIQDHENSYWLAKHGLWRFDPATHRIRQFYEDDRSVFPVYADHQNQVWFGREDGLSVINPETFDRRDYSYPIQPQRVPYEFLQCMLQDKEGIYWLGTTKGLLRFDVAKNEWKHYKNTRGDTASLSFDIIFTLCEDPVHPEKYIWIGTNGGGLNRFDKQTEKITRYSMKDGLPNDVIYGILTDAQGNLWMSTNNGLTRFNIKERSFKTYEEKDGLQGNEFNRYAYCSARNHSGKAKNDVLFFGGLNGFNYFNPEDFIDNPYVPEVQITDFKIRNQSISFKQEHSPLASPVVLTSSILLPYSDNMITFEFASMDFTAPEKNRYQYRLDGFDQEWIQSGKNHSATYTNLDPGTYLFNVRGSNSDGVWNETPVQLQLTILPPWYMTWWFRFAVLLAVCSLLYAFYRYRLQQALKLQGIRNRIARDLHDEIGSNLSNISIFSEVAEEKAAETDAVKPLLQKITYYTQSSQEAMSDIVWMINANNDRFENIIVRMRAIAAELFEAKNFLLHLDFDERLNSLKLGMEERKNFYLIFKEAINNIAKYADCKNVWIEMRLNRDTILLVIRDDGIGFQYSDKLSGNGLTNMNRRAELLQGILEINSEEEKGTLVKLTFGI